MHGKGICAVTGMAANKVLFMNKLPITDKNKQLQEPIEKAIEFYDQAVETVAKQLLKMSIRFRSAEELVRAEMFEMHEALLTDKFLREAVIENLQEGFSLESSVTRMIEDKMNVLLSLEDDFMAEKAKDLEDVGARLICKLRGEEYPDLSGLETPVIIAAEDLPPSMLNSADSQMIEGLILGKGSKTAHVVILAANMEIPTIVGCSSIELLKTGDFVFADASKGKFFCGLTDAEQKKAKEEVENYHRRMQELIIYKDKKAMTRDQEPIQIYGNIMDGRSIHKILENGGDGVGLFRTEFLYMNRRKLPSEEEQFVRYRSIAKKLNGLPLTIRTIDIGADKVVECLDLPKEENPFLGYRGIRICMNEEELIKIQLKAILRASAFGKIKVMFPMISGIKELKKMLEILENLKNSMKEIGEKYDPELEVGIMVEVPSAVVLADKLIHMVDFFSIGTNDLTQYTVAVDRGNEKVAYLYDYFNPAVLRMIQHTIDICIENRKQCSVCGEMGTDHMALPLLIGMGLKNISVNPPSILLMKHLLSKFNAVEIQQMSKIALNAETPEEVKDLIRETLGNSYFKLT